MVPVLPVKQRITFRCLLNLRVLYIIFIIMWICRWFSVFVFWLVPCCLELSCGQLKCKNLKTKFWIWYETFRLFGQCSRNPHQFYDVDSCLGLERHPVKKWFFMVGAIAILHVLVLFQIWYVLQATDYTEFLELGGAKNYYIHFSYFLYWDIFFIW